MTDGRPLAVRWVEPATTVPTLRVRVAPGGRVLVEADDDPLLVARVDRDWGWVSLAYAHAAGRPVQVLPPWTAAECRRIGADGTRWSWEIRDRLRAGPRSPLHVGGWQLTEHPHPWRSSDDFASEAAGWLADDLVEPTVRPDGSAAGDVDYVRHLPGSAAVLVPLRVLSAPDAPRVRAQRRLVREGALAPVVLLRVSGLAGHVVLDGHDRLVAARAEGVVPPFACLARTDADDDERAQALAVAGYERTMGLLDGRGRPPGRLRHPDEHRAQAARRLAAELAADRAAPTWAWPLPVEEWQAVARRIAPDWHGLGE